MARDSSDVKGRLREMMDRIMTQTDDQLRLP